MKRGIPGKLGEIYETLYQIYAHRGQFSFSYGPTFLDWDLYDILEQMQLT